MAKALLSADPQDLVLGKHSFRSLGQSKDFSNHLRNGSETMLLEPVDDIGLAGHRPNFDALPTADEACRYARIDEISQGFVAPRSSLDDRSGVHSGAGPEGISSHYWIVVWQGNAGSLGDQAAVLGKCCEIVLPPAKKMKIDQKKVDGSIAHAFADAHRGAVDAIGAGLYCGQCVGYSKAAIAVAVPVHFDV